jgi:histidinol-phosphate aminotransferase
LAGGAGLALISGAQWEAAAQVVGGSGLRDIRGVGLDDPELVELSINENALGPSRLAVERVAGRMFGMNRYPFHDQLEQALARHHDVPVESILTGVGSSEILNLVMLAAYFDRGGNTVTAFPSYPDVARRTAAFGRELRRVPLTADLGIDLDAIAHAIDSETRVVFICNPNNPTGQLLGAPALRRFVESVPRDVIVCIDEAYIQFVEEAGYPSAIALALERDNVVVTRTFSKAHGLGGVRVGYGIADPALIERLARFGLGQLNKNALSIAAALGALADTEHVARTVEVVRAGKAYLSAQLEQMGYTPLKTHTIFVTVEIGPRLSTWLPILRERKVKVRQAFDMDGFMRVTAGLPRENEAFIEELRAVAGS